MIRLVLVDDQVAVRQGLRMRLLLEPEMAVIGEASNGKEALALVQQLCPDVVLMDIEMPDIASLLWLRQWCQTAGSGRVLMMRHLEFLRQGNGAYARQFPSRNSQETLWKRCMHYIGSK